MAAPASDWRIGVDQPNPFQASNKNRRSMQSSHQHGHVSTKTDSQYAATNNHHNHPRAQLRAMTASNGTTHMTNSAPPRPRTRQQQQQQAFATSQKSTKEWSSQFNRTGGRPGTPGTPI